jgi:hypothetical protein
METAAKFRIDGAINDLLMNCVECDPVKSIHEHYLGDFR